MKHLNYFLLFIAIFNISFIENDSSKTIRKLFSCTLRLYGIKCNQTEGFWTEDRIYFKIRGEDWPATKIIMNIGKYVELEGHAIGFNEEIKIELWEQNYYGTSAIFLGKVIIPCGFISDGVASFSESGVDYKLYYKVY